MDPKENQYVKPGVSGGARTPDGGSVRSNKQANKWNRESGEPGRYEPGVEKDEPEGASARKIILNIEREDADYLRCLGHHQDPRKFQRP